MTAPRLAFDHFEFGCVGDQVALVAWAPASTNAPLDGWRAPATGDYYGDTGWIGKTGCGYSGEQRIEVLLTEHP